MDISWISVNIFKFKNVNTDFICVAVMDGTSLFEMRGKSGETRKGANKGWKWVKDIRGEMSHNRYQPVQVFWEASSCSKGMDHYWTRSYFLQKYNNEDWNNKLIQFLFWEECCAFYINLEFTVFCVHFVSPMSFSRCCGSVSEDVIQGYSWWFHMVWWSLQRWFWV